MQRLYKSVRLVRSKRLYLIKNMLIKKDVFSIVLVEFATLMIASFWGLYFQATSLVKSIFSIFIWLSVFFFPYKYLKKNDYGKVTNYVIIILLFLGVFAILRSCFNHDVALYSFGNKWITLLFNEYCALLYIPLLFVYVAANPRNLYYLKILIVVYLIFSIPFFTKSSQNLFYIVIVLAPLYSYYNIFYKLLVFSIAFKAVLFAFVGDNPARSMILFVSFSLLAFVLAYVVKNSYLKVSLLAITVFIVFFAYIPLLDTTGEGGIFVEMQDYLSSSKDIEDFSTDTRTFLYNEMGEDLKRTKSYLFGKGALSYYYSLYFDSGAKGKYGRMTSEVTFLNWLLHSGLIYVVLYYFLLLYGAAKAIYQGKNDFVKCVAIVAVGWFFNSFISDLNGARFYHVVFFILLGCCYSKKWLNYSNKQVRYIFSKGYCPKKFALKSID